MKKGDLVQTRYPEYNVIVVKRDQSKEFGWASVGMKIDIQAAQPLLFLHKISFPVKNSFGSDEGTISWAICLHSDCCVIVRLTSLEPLENENEQEISDCPL